MQTTFAARAVLNRLNANFSNRNFLFAASYDFNRGLDPDFKRRMTQIPIAKRGKDWIAIMWSRDPESLSCMNKRFWIRRDTPDSTKKQIIFGRLVYCSVVFTYVSNSVDYLEDFTRDFFDYVPDGFNTVFFNTPFPEWKAKKAIQLNATFLSRVFNGLKYVCTKAGTTGTSEPKWTSTGTIKDGSVVWTAMQPETMSVQFDNIAMSGLTKFPLQDADTLVKFDIGGRMFYPILKENIDPNTGLPSIFDPTDPNSGKPINSDPTSGDIVAVIKYPKADVFEDLDTKAVLLDTVTNTPEHWGL